MITIKEGMPWSEAISILNGYISEIENIKKAIGECVVDGRIDYNTLSNQPRINAVQLSDKSTSEELNISVTKEQLNEIASICENRTASLVNQSLSAKVSADISSLQSADADIAGISFFINDAKGVAKKISIGTLRAFFKNEVATQTGGVTVNNGGDTSSIAQELSDFKSQVTKAITQIQDTVTSGGIALTDCSEGTCKVITSFELSNRISK